MCFKGYLKILFIEIVEECVLKIYRMILFIEIVEECVLKVIKRYCL